MHRGTPIDGIQDGKPKNENSGGAITRELGQTNMTQEMEERRLGGMAQLEGFDLCGWAYDPQLSWDANWMDLCMLITRNSKLRQGSMGCILVRQAESSNDSEDVTLRIQQSWPESVISAANNMPLFKPNDSDIHAEICAIGKASRLGRSTNGATAFITMPPCKRCFGALVAAGIRSIVSRHDLSVQQQEVARSHGITFASISKDDMEKSYKRIQQLVQSHNKRKEIGEDNGNVEQLSKMEAKKQRATK
jgi:deoxycytidylate deaminase